MTYQTINPLTEELVRTFRSHTDAELAAMIAKAEDTFQNDWSQRSLVARKAINKAASILRRDRDEFAKLVTLEMGTLFREAPAPVSLDDGAADRQAHAHAPGLVVKNAQNTWSRSLAPMPTPVSCTAIMT